MTVAATTDKSKPPQDDPEQYRMSLGDHLEELRFRMIFALIGFAVAFGICLFYGKTVIYYFCAPLYKTLLSRHINPQMYYDQVGEPFMVYIHISLIAAATFSAPWALYQIWMFIAAGLYAHERKWVTRYIPLSLLLLISGMLFVYFLVLPWTVQFFIDWGNSFQPPANVSPIITGYQSLPQLPSIAGDPENPPELSIWYNDHVGQIKVRLKGQTGILQFLPSSLIAPHITLDKYINMVIMMLLTFGLSFQLPLIVMALVKIGIVERDTLKQSRKIVYFMLLIVASVITPGDVITATIALTVPLAFLYELGIWLARPAKNENLEMA
jgi:sec-independent protein translocase protein TatC